MEKLLIYIKHHLKFVWVFIEGGNEILFSLFFTRKMNRITGQIILENEDSAFSFRRLNTGDCEDLYNLINAQGDEDLKYFHPHKFDRQSIRKQFKMRSFLMMGAFHNDKMVGYFFLRFFSNRNCFVGRLIDLPYRGKGIGQRMNRIMYETAWGMNFRCLSTISRHNVAVMRAHAKNGTMIVRKELANDFILVEFVAENEH